MKGGQAFPGDQVPYTDGAVDATGGEESAVKVQGQSIDRSSVPTQRQQVQHPEARCQSFTVPSSNKLQ